MDEKNPPRAPEPDLTIPGVRTLSLQERADEGFNRLGGQALPVRTIPALPESFLAQWRAEGGEREDAGKRAWAKAKVEQADEIHAMLRFLCAPRLRAMPENLDPAFLLKLVREGAPDDRALFMQVEETGRRSTRHMLSLGLLRSLAWYALANMPAPAELPPAPVVNSANEQVIALRARRETLAALKAVVYERLGVKHGALAKVVELIDEVSRQPYRYERGSNANDG